MKILIVNRFFGGAQIPTGRMAEDVARVLVEGGYDVTALASTGTYAGAEKRARDHGTTGPQDDPPTRSPRQASPAGQGALSVETVNVPKWMPRAVAWVWFTWQARTRIPRMDWDVCVLMTDPPLLPLLVPRAKSADGPWDHRTTGPRTPKRRVAVWLMDLYPEALAASGRLSETNPIYRWYLEKRQRALAAADLLICLGRAQKERAQMDNRTTGHQDHGTWTEGTGGRGQAAVEAEELSRAKRDSVSPASAGRRQTLRHRNTEPPGALGPRTVVVPPWDDRGNIALATEESLRNLALYAGNLGEAHCFEEILAAAPHLPRDWTIRFAARGAKLSALKAVASGTTGPRDDRTTGQDTKRLGAEVEVTGYASEEETPGLLAAARVHLITMSPGWEGIVVPSKLYGCIRTGRPVLFVGPENADTAREIRAHDWGAVLSPGASGEQVAAAILELAARATREVRPQQGAAEVAELIAELGR